MAWCAHASHAEQFIEARLPAIVLNTFLVKKDILTFEQFVQLEKFVPKWADSIKECALSEARLLTAVAAVVKGMEQFAYAQ